VEDRRGQTGGRGVRIGLVGFVILAIASIVFRTNLFALLEDTDTVSTGPAEPVPSSPEEDRAVQFVSFVLDDVQATWRRILPEWRDAHLVLFRDGIDTACGYADAGIGPFYCPEDERVYLDLSFFDELHDRFGAPGDFAQAYVIAHEIGHHVQHILGTDTRARAAGEGGGSVKLELQADCYAGIWGRSTEQRQILEAGDVDEALGAASAIGDDRLQRSAGRRVNPDSFTHGTSRERVGWFERGFQSGDPSACDTWAAGAGTR
jgi:hypothetical protein